MNEPIDLCVIRKHSYGDDRGGVASDWEVYYRPDGRLLTEYYAGTAVSVEEARRLADAVLESKRTPEIEVRRVNGL